MLSTLTRPEDLGGLSHAELAALAAEIRRFLIDNLAATGGHLGSNLGAVELTIALHRVFADPEDSILWDTGHQAYVHKLLTGRAAAFGTLRRLGGLSGYPSRAESVHDVVENSHASTALSYAAGFAASGSRRRVVAVVGDGALTGGLAFEALNQIGHHRLDVTVVVNDNGRSYAPTAGALAGHLTDLRAESARRAGARRLAAVLGDVEVPEPVPVSAFFASLGLGYAGPVDGHDLPALEAALQRAADTRGPVVVHAVTRKGEGVAAARHDPADRLHAVGPYDRAGGPRQPGLGARSWTARFSQAIVREATRDEHIVAITAAMRGPVGLDAFAAAFPGRIHDVGIAEQHAVTFAAGLALGGLRPVVAVYATFLNRAFDQVLMDVGLHRLPVTFVLDRAGVTGSDGPSHHGVFDLGTFRQVPGLTIAAPADAQDLADVLHTALHHDGPFLLRMPKGDAPGSVERPPRVVPIGTWDVESRPGGVAVVAAGPMLAVAHEVAARLEAAGVPCGVTNARFVKPLDARVGDLAGTHRLLVTIEDHRASGGLGAAVLEHLAAAGVTAPVECAGVPDAYLEHGPVDALHRRAGLDAESLVHRILVRLGQKEQRCRQ